MSDVMLVTGASSGIGQACADRMHQQGWTVYGASRSVGSGPRGEINDIGTTGWHAVTMDVDDDRSVADGVARVIDDAGHIDAVVACAGWGLAGAVEHTSLEDAKDQLETNFWGAVRLVQQALPTLRSRGRGRIVLVSSIGGVLGIPFQAFYSASKFALEGFGEALAYEVAPFGIEVTLVEPGNVATGFTAARRDAQPGSGEDPYADAVARAVGKMVEDEAGGVLPTQVATTVQRVLEARRPPRRVSVGKLDERIGIAGKRLLPYRLFERAAKGSLGV